MSRSLEDLERDAFLAEAESIAQLLQHPAWPRYEELLAKMRLGAMELMGNAKSLRAVSRYQGAIAILRELMERPHQIVATATAIVSEEKQQATERRALDFEDRITLEDDL